MSSDKESKQGGNEKLVDIREKRREKADKDKPEKIPLKEIYRNYAEAMHGRNPFWPSFPKKFHILGGAVGGYILLEENNAREVIPVGEDRVIRAIMDYSYDQLRAQPDMLLTYGQAKECLGSFVGYGHDLATEPSLVAGKDEPELTYRRLPFDLVPSLDAKDHCPVFMEAVSRMTEGDAFCAFVGSLFDNDADLSQYLWIYGQGGEGKSSVAAVIAEIFGNAAWHSQPPSQNDRFWAYNLIGKRLVIFPDCNDYRFVTTGPFKSLTGGDKQSLEPKGKAHVQMRLKTKFLFLSNREPDISSAPSDIRRAIICDMSPFAGSHDPLYQEKLNAEIEPIVNYCLAKYQEIAGKRRLIPTATDRVKELAEENEEAMASFLERVFHFSPDETIKRQDFADKLREVGVKSNTQIKIFKKYMLSNMNVKFIDEKDNKHYKGVGLLQPRNWSERPGQPRTAPDDK